MATEPKRGCGYRKVGGLYLMADKPNASCGKLPIPLTVCPCCSQGIKPARGWTWVKPEKLLDDARCSRWRWATPERRFALTCMRCPARDPSALADESGRCGLIWIGEQFYPTPQHFLNEANRMGISRRITAVPKGFEPGKTWVMFASRKAATIPLYHSDAELYLSDEDDGDELYAQGGIQVPGIFCISRSTALEKIVKQSDYNHELIEELEKRKITAVPVPDDDPDHR